jgi:hypothetical protein
MSGAMLMDVAALVFIAVGSGATCFLVAALFAPATLNFYVLHPNLLVVSCFGP